MNNFKEKVKQAVDIVDLIGEFVELKKSGKTWKGKCPFHEEKTPGAFTVYPETQTFKCFSCGKQGDVIEFMKHYKNLTFQEVLKDLADRVGLSPPPSKKLTKKEKELQEGLSFTVIISDLKNKDQELKEKAKKENWNDLLTQEMRNDAFNEKIPYIRKLDSLHQDSVKKWLKDNWSISATSFNQELRGKKRQKPSKKQFNPRLYSEKILEKFHLKFDKYKRFWIYNKETGIWEEGAEIYLNSILRKEILGSDDYKRYCVGEIIADLQGLTYVTETPEEPERYLIPFKNKIYNLKNDEFLNYSPKYFFLNKLAVSINEENKECPAIDKEIFAKIVEEEDVVSLYEIIAYCLWRGYPYPKLFILYGGGANGKGVFLKILKRFLGEDNISLVSNRSLQNDKFASSGLYKKMLNASSEMEYNIIKNTEMMKKVCGEDLIYCERKFKEPFPFMNYAKMLFLTNQVPMTRDRTFAFYRRIFLLEFPNRFIIGEDADPMIVEKLPEKEFEGLAWQSLGFLKSLYSNDFVFTRHERTEEVTKKYEDLSNPLSKFLEENTQREPNSDIPVREFNEKYIFYLKDNGFRIWTDKEITKAMRDKGFSAKIVSKKEEDYHAYKAWLELEWLDL